MRCIMNEAVFGLDVIDIFILVEGVLEKDKLKNGVQNDGAERSIYNIHGVQR